MSKYVVVGAGPVGRETARLLGEQGHSVVLVGRSLAETGDGSIHQRPVDASNAAALTEVSVGAEVIFMCAMAAYDRWPADYFPILDGTVTAAAAVGARLVMVGNVYGYGEHAQSPLTATTPLDPTTRKGTVRTIMWQRAVRSSVPTIEIRASDYLGRGAGSLFAFVALPQLLQGGSGPLLFPQDPHVPHAWSHVADVARTAIAAAHYKGQWNRAFMVPSQNASLADLVQAFATARGVPTPALRLMTAAELVAQGLGEVVEMLYLLDRPLLLDTAETEAKLGIKASSLGRMVEDTVAGLDDLG